MPVDNETTIFDFLKRIEAKLDNVIGDHADTKAEVAGLKATVENQKEATRRFWDTTWPQQLADRNALLERIEKLEAFAAKAGVYIAAAGFLSAGLVGLAFKLVHPG